MDFINPVRQLLSCWPADMDEGLQNFPKGALALFIVLEQRTLVHEVAAHNPENNILSQLLVFASPPLSRARDRRKSKEDFSAGLVGSEEGS
jgi:hypothetical protein